MGDDFSYSGEVNADVLEAVNMTDSADKSEVRQKLFFGSFYRDPWANSYNPTRGSRRQLQSSTNKKLFNPVLCITEGDAIFFNVDSARFRYPVYSKDSILNTNDDFDFGDFETLADMINRQNITVKTFSFVFSDQGIFVFENSITGTLTVISVVGAGQTCSNAVNGVGAAMVTKESLAEIGIKSYDKQISPNWYFIIGCFVSINSLIYAIIGLFIWSYNLTVNAGRQSGKAQSSNTLYYDKIREHDEDLRAKSCFNVCCACFKKKENKVAEEIPDKTHDFSVSYKDMETLLEDFHTCQDILKKQLKDLDKRKRGGDDDEDENDNREPIENLIKELNEMARFVNENNAVVDKVLESEMNIEAGVETQATENKTDKEFFVPENLQHMSKLKREVTIMIDKQSKREEEYNKKVQEQFEVAQEEAFHRVLDSNAQMKD